MLKALLRAIVAKTSRPSVQNWLANISVGSFFAQLAPLPTYGRVVLGAITLTFFLVSFPLLATKVGSLLKSLIGYVQAYWAFLLLILVTLALVLQLVSPPGSIPREIRDSRNS